jgi:Tol biopolymer transport system component
MRGLCEGVLHENGSACDDGIDCTFDDVCDYGECVGTEGEACLLDSNCDTGQFCDVGACNCACQPRTCDLDGAFGTITSVFGSSITASGFSLSQDGLRAYISRKPSSDYELYVASRASTFDAFGTPTLLANVNTSLNERSPWISPDELSLYFWRVNVVNSNLYVATRSDPGDPFGEATALTSLNSSYSDEDPYFNFAGDRIYFVSDRPGGDREFFTSAIVSGSFTAPTKITNLNSYTEEHHPVISRDELRIYIGSENDGFEGDTNGDIWMSERASTSSSFATPTNLTSLNTSGREDPVYLSPDGCTLYFMSNRDTGGGGTQTYRIYSATRADP